MNRRQPLEPAFAFSVAPDPVRLYQGRVSLTREDVTHEGDGAVLLKFAPDPRIVIRVKLQVGFDIGMAWGLCATDDLSLQLDGRNVPGFRGKFEADKSGLDLEWHPASLPLERGATQCEELVHVISHVFNFPDFMGAQHPTENVPVGRRLLLLEFDGWQFLVQALAANGTRDAWKKIKEEGLCQLTHVMEIKRKDAAVFTAEEVKIQLVLLREFCSFVCGSRNWPVCDVGFDASGEQVWQSFCSPDSGNPPCSWPDSNEGWHIEALFPLFAARWSQSPEWRDCLRHAIYWYAQSNGGNSQPGVDSALILVQAALERLAHHHEVVDQKLLSRRGFKRLAASGRLRLLLSSLHIPLGVPDSLSGIKRSAKSKNWADAPHALTAIRNSLVHPDSSMPAENCFLEAWMLGLCYLELAVLAMCGYEGSYRNRFNHGQVEDVPWVDGGG